MDPLIVAALIKGGGDFLTSVFGNPGYQERQGFTDPQHALDDFMRQNTELQGRVRSQQISLPSAYAQAPPTFTGGGLPMPIGLTGRDPALDAPGLLHYDFGGIGGTLESSAPPGTKVPPAGSPYRDAQKSASSTNPSGGRGFAPPDGSIKAVPLRVSRRSVNSAAPSSDASDFVSALRLLGARY